MSKLKRERTLIEQLQSTIDKRAGYIHQWELSLPKKGEEDLMEYMTKSVLAKLKVARVEQTLDKRAMGRLIELSHKCDVLEGHLSHAYGLLADVSEENAELHMKVEELRAESGVIVWQD